MSTDTVSQSVKERRVSPRVPLDAPFFVTLRRSDGPELPALVVDLSRGGVQLALPPDASENFHAWLSCQVTVLGLPPLVGFCGSGCAGMICWISMERCGVRFDTPLSVSDASLRAVIMSL